MGQVGVSKRNARACDSREVELTMSDHEQESAVPESAGTHNSTWARRAFLRGVGTTLALPFLEALAPTAALAAGTRQSLAPPRRLAFLYIPNGVQVPKWTPTREGANYALPYILEPLKAFQKDFLVLTGLTHDKARVNGDGGGAHARSSAAFLTGVQAVKTNGAGIRLGTSVDQIVARVVGRETRLSSLEMSCEAPKSGSCDSGYSCAYTGNISWRTETTPLPREIDPLIVFERLFRSGNRREDREGLARRRRDRRSVLDFVLGQARGLQRRIGTTDRQKLDQYFTAIRELERRLEWVGGTGRPTPTLKAPEPGVPEDYREHLRLLADMMVLAFQGDVTRVASLMFANAGSNRSFRFIGVPEGHHELSHHAGDLKKQEKISHINRFQIEQLAYLLGRLKEIPEGDGTLLDHCMIMYGSGISDGNSHNHENLPILLAGCGGGSIDAGRHIRYPMETPLSNLYVSLLDRMGVPTESFGDSTGRLDGLTVGLPRVF
jgi:hypothetical protein